MIRKFPPRRAGAHSRQPKKDLNHGETLIRQWFEAKNKMKNIPKAQAFAITLEKAGGSAAPTLEQLFVMGNV